MQTAPRAQLSSSANPRLIHWASLSVALCLVACGGSDTVDSGAAGASAAGTSASGGSASGQAGNDAVGGAAASGGTTAVGGSSAGDASVTLGGSSDAAGGPAMGGLGGTSSGTGGVANGGAGAGTSGVGGTAGTSGSGGTAGFALTSPALAPNAMFAPANTCAGANRSLELDWTPGPATTMSYALVLTDTNNSLLHWVIWDIPVETRSLAAMLGTTQVLTMPEGAHQVSINNYGYSGPCPNGQTHIYRFDLHAINVKTLPGLPASPSTAQANAAITAASIVKVSVSGNSNAKRP